MCSLLLQKPWDRSQAGHLLTSRWRYLAQPGTPGSKRVHRIQGANYPNMARRAIHTPGGKASHLLEKRTSLYFHHCPTEKNFELPFLMFSLHTLSKSADSQVGCHSATGYRNFDDKSGRAWAMALEVSFLQRVSCAVPDVRIPEPLFADDGWPLDLLAEASFYRPS